MIAPLAFYSCDDENTTKITPPSSAAWDALREAAMDGLIQRATLNITSSLATFESAKGATLSIETFGLCFEDGEPIDQDGTLDLEFVEIYDKATMLLTNKPSMGHNGDGNKRLLETGGMFYVNVTQGGKKVTVNGSDFMSLTVPVALTNTTDVANDMTLWSGVIGDDGNLTWVQVVDMSGTEGIDVPIGDPSGIGVPVDWIDDSSVNYIVVFGNFGWSNIDRFLYLEGEKTGIKVAPPVGFDNKNSAVYISFDGEGDNQLSQVYLFEEGHFYEIYEYFPVGLNVHLIFVSEDNGKWLYATKGVEIAKETIYSFTLEDLKTANEAQLIAAIKALP